MEKYEHAVVEVGAMAGDVVIFTETATHVRLPCRRPPLLSSRLRRRPFASLTRRGWCGRAR